MILRPTCRRKRERVQWQVTYQVRSIRTAHKDEILKKNEKKEHQRRAWRDSSSSILLRRHREYHTAHLRRAKQIFNERLIHSVSLSELSLHHVQWLNATSSILASRFSLSSSLSSIKQLFLRQDLELEQRYYCILTNLRLWHVNRLTWLDSCEMWDLKI